MSYPARAEGLVNSILVVFCVVSSFTTFRPNFTSGLLQVILPRPRIGMLSLVTVSPVITAFHSCCLSHHVFDQVNLWPAWVGFETAIFWQCSPGTVETQRLYPLRHGPRILCYECFCHIQSIQISIVLILSGFIKNIFRFYWAYLQSLFPVHILNYIYIYMREGRSKICIF